MYFDYMPGDLIGGDNIFMTNNSRASRLATVFDETELRLLRRVFGSASSLRYPEFTDSQFDAIYHLFDEALCCRISMDLEEENYEC